MSDFIIVGDEAVNLDHVTDLKFFPATTGTDDETNEPFEIPASIKLVMTSTETDVLTTFETVDGVAAISRVLEFKGETAEKIWNRIRGAFSASVLE